MGKYAKNSKSGFISKTRNKKELRVFMFAVLVFITLALIIILEKIAKIKLGPDGLNLNLLDLPISFISAAYIIIVVSLGLLSKDRRITPKLYHQYIVQGALSFIAILISIIITSKYGLNIVRGIILAVTIVHGIYLVRITLKERIIAAIFLMPMILLHIYMLYIGFYI